MPLDTAGAVAPLSRWAERLARLKIIRRKSHAEQRRRRIATKQRLETADSLLGHIIDGAHHLGEVNQADEMIARDARRRPLSGDRVALLVTIDVWQFERLCEYGAALEDLEDSHDREADPTCDVGEEDRSDEEPSLGALEMIRVSSTAIEDNPCDHGGAL